MRTRHRPTTCSSARRAATRAAPTTPTTSSPQPPKDSTPPARVCAARSTSSPNRWPGIPIRRGNRRDKAADLADGTWPNLTGKLKPHDYRHSHATWLDAANLPKVIQMDRRGHALQGMDRVYMHVTRQMRERLCEVLEELWQDALTERYKIDKCSQVPLLDQLLRAHETAQQPGIKHGRGDGQTAKISDLATRSDTRRAQRPAS